MKALKFTLSGKTAFFKRPEVNTNYYFTFGNIHKVALLGIFGAILGYQGYNATKDKGLPEFYQKLHDLKISIIPRNKNGYISKKIQYFNNSVGYASNELGGNLIVKEQWLENPIWDIVVLLDCQEADMLALSLLNNTCIYITYLVKNDHPDNISNVEIIELTEKKINEDKIVCLFPKDMFEEADDQGNYYKYQESLPIGLNKETGMYDYEIFIQTNLLLDGKTAYSFNQENIIFY